MSLKFSQKRVRVEFSDGDFVEVRGLALTDLTQLVDVHKETVSGLFDKFTGRDPASFGADEAGQLALNLVTVFPDIAAHVIALGADALDQLDLVRQLPIDVQVLALEQIGTLTFSTQGGPKNVLETVLRMASGTNGLLSDMKKSRH